MKNQLLIPFQLEGNTANRQTIRTVTKAAGDALVRVQLKNMKLRPVFNGRIQGDIPDDLWEKILMIPELADGIFESNGPAEPPIGDIYSVDGCFYQTEGERRIRALNHLVRTGREFYPNGQRVDDVLVLLNPPGTTDLQRKLKIGTTQNKLPLTTMQWAYYYKSLTVEFKLTHAQVGEMLNISRSKVDQYILATKLQQDVQDDIDAGKKNITNEIKAMRQAKADADDDKHEKTPSEQAHDRKKDEEGKKSGDEDDFEQQDNSVKGVSSKGGPKEDTSSGAITIGKDAIYKNQEDDARWKQFIHRYDILHTDCALAAEGDVELMIKKLTERLKMEYVLQIK